uniref:Uncharacterized protein n=1 Tax=Anguilla anguilla TaxID=7936 RepID=A0A0E9TBG5_ANGAN
MVRMLQSSTAEVFLGLPGPFAITESNSVL